MIPEDAQEFVSRCIWSTRTGFPFGERGLRDAQGGGKISLIEAETAAEAEDELGRGGVFSATVDDDKRAAWRIVGDAAGGAVGEGHLSNVVELR